MKASTIKVIKKEQGIYWFKNKIVRYLETYKDKAFMYLFILGDKKGLDTEEYNVYKNNGIAHLLAISGMHISLFIEILRLILCRLDKKGQFLIIIIFLAFYLFLTDFAVSVLRVVFFFVFSSLNSYFKLGISRVKLMLLVIILLLTINYLYIYSVAFLYSCIISLGIILSSDKITGNYWLKILKITLISTLFSLPITVSLNYEFNIMSLIVNLVMVPYVTLLLYPVSLIVFIIKPLSPIFSILVMIFQLFNCIFDKIAIIINIPKMSVIIIICYYIFLVLYILIKKKRYLLYICTLIFINKTIPYFDRNFYVYYMDIGQGDSTILISPNKKETIMIDTGGKLLGNYKVSDNVILYLKSLGITKIDYLILTHGDFDHMGDSLNIVEKYKVKNVIFNNDKFNSLEGSLSLNLKKKKIKYYKGYNKLNFAKNYLTFLNTGKYDNENDNSNVIYFKYNNYQFLFMGDASIKREKDILDKYNLEDIDFLKVGHHGSNTSSSEDFINSINPKYSLISVGKNNRYGHPKESVLNILKNSKTYRTDQDGSIEVKLNKKGYKIRTCPP
jgi:competence protein ComEC